MTKMAAMPIYGKNPSKIFFSETNRLISRKLRVKHWWLKYSNVYINHDPVMTLTKFMARSSLVAYAFELGKLLKCHLKGKASRKLANGQNIEDSEKRKWPKGFICPCTGVKYHNIQTCLLVYAADLRWAFTGPLVLWFLFLLQNIDCGYSLEPPQRGGSNVYLQSMFWAKIRKISKFFSRNFQFYRWKNLCILHGHVFVINFQPCMVSGSIDRKLW